MASRKTGLRPVDGEERQSQAPLTSGHIHFIKTAWQRVENIPNSLVTLC